MKIFFKGYYGFENIGDDIFVHIADWYIKNYNNQIQPIFIGRTLPYGINYIKTKNKMEKNFYDLKYLIKSDYIIYWGGSTFTRIGKVKDLKYYISKFNCISKKFLAYGISVGPFISQEKENAVLELLSKSNYVGVRDYESLKYSNNYRFSFDMAILTPSVFPVNKEEKQNRKWNIGINLCEADNLNEYINYIEEFCINETEKINQIRIYIFNGNADIDREYSIKLYKKLIKCNLNVEIIPYTLDTKEFIQNFVNIDFLFGTRLHSAIIAYAYDIKFILNEYHEKCTAFLETINNPLRYDVLEEGFTIEQIETTDYSSLVDPNYFRKLAINELLEINKHVIG